MSDSILTTLILPLSLAIIMFGMGLSLVVDDFKRVIKYPKAVGIGLVNQLILLPILGWLIATSFPLEAGLAVGLVLLAACPGGATSNLITHVAKGDTALSISLTAVCSFITVLTIPLIISFALQYFMGESKTVELNVIQTIAQVFVITVLPVSLGMLIRAKRPNFAKRMERPSRIASTIIFIAIVVGIILANREILVSSVKSLGLVVAVLNILTMGLGYLAARIFRLNLPQTLAITIESGIQNGTLAIVIATTILNQPDIALPAAVYSLMMFLTGGIIMGYFGGRKTDNTAVS